MQYLNNFLASVHYLNHPYLSGLSALLLLLLGVFVFSRDRKNELYRVFLWLNFTITIWFFGNVLSMVNFNNIDAAIFWFRFGYIGAIFISATYYHFYLSFFRKKKTILYFVYASAVLEIIYLWFSEDIRMFAYALPNVGVVWQGISIFSYFLIFGMAKYIIISISVAVMFLREYKQETILSSQIQLKWLSIIFFILFLGATEWLVMFNIQLHIAWLVIPLFTGSIAYAILKHQLMDIKVVVKKAFFYSIGIALVSGAIFGISFLNSWFAENTPGFKFWMIPLVAGLVAFIIGNLFWNKSKEADKLKYEFITVATHKLRTPLTDVKWGLSALRDKSTTEEEKNKLIFEMNSANSRLIILTDELLSVAKTEAGQYQYKFEPVDFEKTVRNIVNNFQHQFKEKGIKLKYDYDKDLLQVKIDKIRMPMIIQILLENAITYTQDRIDISIRKDKNKILFSIKDNGIGIVKDDLPYIFSKFFRTHEAYLTETEGAGIGLFLAKSIIDKHGGKIGVRSEGKGKGSIFWFELKML